jgi:lysozyme family protein
MSFLDALDLILTLEGGGEITEDPDDPGGLTKWGISLQAHPELGSKGIRALTKEAASDIYWRDYWVKANVSSLPKTLRLSVFDAAVNQGVMKAGELLQKALNSLGAGLKIDGVIGPKTIEASKNLLKRRALEAFLWQRLDHYRDLPHYKKFGRGWEMRLLTIALWSHKNRGR